jgi:hypothetical protein
MQPDQIKRAPRKTCPDTCKGIMQTSCINSGDPPLPVKASQSSNRDYKPPPTASLFCNYRRASSIPETFGAHSNRFGNCCGYLGTYDSCQETPSRLSLSPLHHHRYRHHNGLQDGTAQETQCLSYVVGNHLRAESWRNSLLAQDSLQDCPFGRKGGAPTFCQGRLCHVRRQ